jgi:hypothetical protein
MKRRLLITSLIALPLALALIFTTARADDGKVTILKPEEGEVVQGSGYTVEFELDKGSRGDHVHIFLDGKHVAPVTKKSSYKLTRLKKGPHTVTLKLADKNHDYLGPEGEVNFKVE